MKVSELIKQLQQCDPDLEVYTFNDHDIHAIEYADNNMSECVHLNLGAEQ